MSMLIISALMMNTEPVRPFGFLIHEVARLIRSRIEARAGVHGLSEAQLRLLMRLWKEEGATQARLAQILEVEPISISRLLDRMEQGGWIERRQDPSDRRVRTIFTTAKTRQIHGAVKDVATQVYEEALAGVPPDTRDAMLEGLQAMARNLSSDAALAATCFSGQDQSEKAPGAKV
jgi:MarR family transcriptional regulator for hemolysin